MGTESRGSYHRLGRGWLTGTTLQLKGMNSSVVLTTTVHCVLQEERLLNVFTKKWMRNMVKTD
jgi:hypothetical protein